MNSKLKELLNINPDDATKADNDALIEEIKNAKLIMPIEITSPNLNNIEDFHFNPIKIKDDEERTFIPLFSDDSEVYGHSSAINIYTKDLVEMIGDNPENIFGVVINPFSNYGVTLPMDSFLKIFE
ncbi:SseB family protein [uncultured Methanobrevibacter sp.]|uniref:SseB family protein n=1 Tax=uncultured Methanobrevibacter sp. TaxID=253161 RepID=UPI0025D835E9|nr:SseB family protein [uncultured Methanobrevibacter sp.]